MKIYRIGKSAENYNFRQRMTDNETNKMVQLNIASINAVN